MAGPNSLTPQERIVSRVLGPFEAACAQIPELNGPGRLLLGCSAGGDSMALLELMACARAAHGWELGVVHVDHRQRPESAQEAGFVREQAGRLGATAFIEALPDALLETSPLSEDIMRQARHEVYTRCAQAFGARALVLAHQADDRAETFLIRLLAGSGPTGLSSIRAVEQLGELRVVRPLLAIRRDDLRVYLESLGSGWHEDPSNSSLLTKRSWVRHALLPSVHDHIGLDPTERIVRASELIEAEAQALGEAVGMLLAQLTLKHEPPAIGRLDLTAPAWRKASESLRRQLLREWLWSLRRSPHPPGLAPLEQAMAFIQARRPGAQLRTVEMIHLVHCKHSLLAYPPQTPQPERATHARGFY